MKSHTLRFCSRGGGGPLLLRGRDERRPRRAPQAAEAPIIHYISLSLSLSIYIYIYTYVYIEREIHNNYYENNNVIIIIISSSIIIIIISSSSSRSSSSSSLYISTTHNTYNHYTPNSILQENRAIPCVLLSSMCIIALFSWSLLLGLESFLGY